MTSLTSFLGALIGIVALLYGLLVLGLFLAQRALMYHPVSDRPRPGAALANIVHIEEIPSHDWLGLFSWWAAPQDGLQPVVVYFHGNAGTQLDREARMAAMVARGWGVLIPGYRYNSGAGGTPSEQDLIADGVAVLDWLRDQGIGADRTVLYGESLGTGIAVALAGRKDRACAVILDAPYDSIAAVAARHYWYVPVRLLLKDPFDSVLRIPEIQAPILIGHGTLDRVIPIIHGRRLFQAAREPKYFVEKPLAGHTDLFDHGFLEDVAAFLDRIGQDQEAGKSGVGCEKRSAE